MPASSHESTEQPIPPVRGTRDWLPADFARLDRLETLLLDRFARAGYAPLRTPILEPVELHERKSGAGIVAKLFELSDAHQARLCLRPELTASIVRAYTDASEPPPLPWRLSMAGPVFRFEKDPQPGHYREFTQVGVELLGAPGPSADAEVIWLSQWALSEAGIADANVRIGHVGLILEMLERSGLPPSARSALVGSLSLAAAEGRGIQALETALEQFAGWLRAAESDPIEPLAAEGHGDRQADRLFRQLVPDVAGRRSGHEILGRLRHKWDLAHSLHGVLDRVRDQIHELADLRGPAAEVLERLGRGIEAAAPASVAGLRELVRLLGHAGLPADRIELDLGFGRGIGFYSQMVFDLVATTPDGPIEVGGGGRYDGLARVLGSDRDDRGVGFALGLERVEQALRARDGKASRPAPAGCLVTAWPECLDEALSLAVDLRRIGPGRLPEFGPVVGPNIIADPSRLDAALEYARSLGLEQVVHVRGPRVGSESPVWYAFESGRWVESPKSPTILLARDDAKGTP